MPPLVGHNVLLCEHRIGGTVLGDHVVEETEIQVDGGVPGAVERTNCARSATARGRHRIREDLEVGKLVGHAGVLSGELCLPYRVEGLCGRHHTALDALVRIRARLT